MSAHKLKYGLINLRGVQVGDLLVLKRAIRSKKKRPYWHCFCKACGTRIVVSHARLIGRNPKTHCGCKRTAGITKTLKKEYHAWWDACSRCGNPKHSSYSNYGAKGITICNQWHDSFLAFIDYIGEAPEPKQKYSLDRIDPYGNYEPGNVRWATYKQQGRNKRNTKWIKHPLLGIPIKAAILAEEFGISYQALRQRLINEGKWR